jgi:predicted RNase H-like nuclease (RuvC/YqgF family)
MNENRFETELEFELKRADDEIAMLKNELEEIKKTLQEKEQMNNYLKRLADERYENLYSKASEVEVLKKKLVNQIIHHAEEIMALKEVVKSIDHDEDNIPF